MTYINGITAERVASLLAESDMTQAQYAAILNVSQPTVSDKLAGAVQFTAKDIRATAVQFGVTTDFLYGLTDERAPVHAG